MKYFIILLLFIDVKAQDPCAEAPNEAAKIMCRQIHKWDDGARKAASKKKIALPPGMAEGIGKGIAADFAPIASSIYQCMDLACMCTYLRGTATANGGCTLPDGKPLQKAVRKEYRMMTDDERQRFHNAFRTLKENGEYERIGRIHSQMSNSGGAHSGPAFLPWHREFIKRVEFALRQVDPSIFLPYWDSTLEHHLPTPANSAIFSEDFCGGSDANGLVINGPFTNWRTLEGRANIQRKVGAQGSPFSQADIDFVMRQTEVDQVLAFTSPRQGCPYRTDFNCLEYTHGNVHIFVGGDMFDTSTSANDPIFFMHHSFVDLIWEQWRLAKQSRADRELLYPPDNQLCSSNNHFGAGGLLPFTPMRNVDGLSNKFTDNLYSYAPRPTCSAANANCGSPALFCDLSHGNARCAAKIRKGAPCPGFTRGENPCYNGICQGGVCVATANTTPTVPTVRPTQPPVRIQPQETCFNENHCCATWASKGECSRNTGYMNEWCKASCAQCKPQYRLVDDCTDRHVNCPTWSRSGECTKNQLWMSENCRKSCNKCKLTRSQECGSNAQQTATTTASPIAACDNSDGCYNENVCCPHWGLMGECRSSSPWMACNCRVSCGHCTPTDYNYGSCTDYHKDCAGWARVGECQKNPWMAENCRASCRTCYSQYELRDKCRGRAGSVKPVAEQNMDNRQFNAGGWGPRNGGNQGGWNRGGGGGGGWGNNDWFGGWGGGGWGGRWGRSASAPAFSPAESNNGM
ncbi:unnamed protein product [Auanema sp. JU1783]|nr:unnamed protein product [Auanema sp. JU1783]